MEDEYKTNIDAVVASTEATVNTMVSKAIEDNGADISHSVDNLSKAGKEAIIIRDQMTTSKEIINQREQELIRKVDSINNTLNPVDMISQLNPDNFQKLLEMSQKMVKNKTNKH